MRNAFRLAFVVAIVAGLAACSQVAPKAPAVGPESATSTQGAARTLSFIGTSRFSTSPMGTTYGLQSPEFPATLAEHDAGSGAAGSVQAQGLANASHGSRFLNRIPEKQSTPITPPQSSGVAPAGLGSGPSSTGGAGGASKGSSAAVTFEGLNHFDQRYADNGNQFSLEPPDQGLCAGTNYVLEAVNDVVQVYTKDGTPQGVASLNRFFQYPSAIDRGTGRYGPFITDPSCLYDSTTHRWFLMVLTLDVDPATGDFLGTNHLDIATSTSSNPLGAWNIYSLDVTKDGHSNYNLGDYPHFAVNADGMFITTDSFPFFGSGYNGAWLYGIQKSALIHGTDAAVYAASLRDTSGSSYSVAPAINVGSMPAGTEYMVSSTTAYATSSSTIAVWAVTNTDSLDSSHPVLHVVSDLVNVGGSNGLSSGSYGDPLYYSVPQKAGSVPLAEAIYKLNLYGLTPAPGPQPEGPIATNDSGMKQAVFVDGQLYSALTSVADNGAGPGGGPGAGVAWFQVTPSFTGNGKFSPSLVRAGLVAPQGQNLIFPAITVTPGGQGAIAATLVGPNDYPSAAVIPFSDGRAGSPSILMKGAGPEDGFLEYDPYNSPRWGDYGAAVVDPQGNIWLGSEAIHQTCTYNRFRNDTTCGGTRSILANWSTQLSEITP